MSVGIVRALAATTVFVGLLASGGAAFAQDDAAPAVDLAAIDPLLADADVVRGKAVYARVGICVECHGWTGNGIGSNPRSPGNAADLRMSALDAQGFIEIIRCGIPGTPMPYHNSAAYRDPEICYGLTAADFEAGSSSPVRGKTFREVDIVNVTAYIMTSIQGREEVTLAECEEYFESSTAGACDFLR